MTSRSWIRNLFARRNPLPIRKTPGLGHRPFVETLEDRIAPAGLQYTAIDTTPLALRLTGPDLQVVNTTSPSQVLASAALSDITSGVRIEGAGFDVNLTIDASVPLVGGGHGSG